MLNKFLNLIKNAAIKGGYMASANRPISIAIFLTLLFAVLGVLDAYNAKYLVGSEGLISLDAWLGGLLAIWGLFLLYQRTENQGRQLGIQTKELENQNKQINIQINKEIDDRFIAAVTLLGSGESSARTGAVYSLYHLAIESEKYRKQIAQILCSYIRSKTQEKEYQAEHKDRPSNEIQTAIDILFKDINGVKGLFCQEFSQERDIPEANLSYAYLHGADFVGAQCQHADFSYAQCQHADFNFAKCQRAIFRAAQFYNTSFVEAQCQHADFSFAECYSATFTNAHCRNSNFIYARCAHARFFSTKFYGARLEFAQCQFASFYGAECQGAYFGNAQCQSANFHSAKCQGANFHLTAFQLASFNEETDFCGAYSYDASDSLESRIGETTEVVTAIFEGEVSLESINAIEEAKPYFPDGWYQHMQNLINDNKGKPELCGVPEHIATGVLKDSEEIRKIAAEIRKWER